MNKGEYTQLTGAGARRAAAAVTISLSLSLSISLPLSLQVIARGDCVHTVIHTRKCTHTGILSHNACKSEVST